MRDIKKIASQLDVLLKEYDDLRSRSKYPDMSDNSAESRVLANRLQAAIDRLAPLASTYTKQANLHRVDPASVRLPELRGIATALRDDLQSGWIDSMVELVHDETHGDFLEMTEELFQKGYKDAAAIIAGTTLEVHLRALCTKCGVDTAANGKPKKADAMNIDLKKVSAYEGLQQKQVTSWLGLRNSAAHGQYQDYDAGEVRQFIAGVRAFIIKYSA